MYGITLMLGVRLAGPRRAGRAVGGGRAVVVARRPSSPTRTQRRCRRRGRFRVPADAGFEAGRRISTCGVCSAVCSAGEQEAAARFMPTRRREPRDARCAAVPWMATSSMALVRTWISNRGNRDEVGTIVAWSDR